MQHNKAHHVIQLREIDNHFLCRIRALKALLASRQLPPTARLFSNSFYPNNQGKDIHSRDALTAVLHRRNISITGHGFHTFRRSGATFAFDNYVPTQNIMSHGLEKLCSMDIFTKCFPGILQHSFHLWCPQSSFFLNLGLVVLKFYPSF